MVGIMLMLCSCGKSESVAKWKDIPIQSEFILFDYQELKETSKLIVKAKIMDDLSKENSVIEMDTEDTDSISSAYSLRNIELLEIYGVMIYGKIKNPYKTNGGKPTSEKSDECNVWTLQL